MPVMLRMNGLATKIAFKIMGVPANMKRTKKKTPTYNEKRLLAEYTARVK